MQAQCYRLVWAHPPPLHTPLQLPRLQLCAQRRQPRWSPPAPVCIASLEAAKGQLGTADGLGMFIMVSLTDLQKQQCAAWVRAAAGRRRGLGANEGGMGTLMGTKPPLKGMEQETSACKPLTENASTSCGDSTSLL